MKFKCRLGLSIACAMSFLFCQLQAMEPAAFDISSSQNFLQSIKANFQASAKATDWQKAISVISQLKLFIDQEKKEKQILKLIQDIFIEEIGNIKDGSPVLLKDDNSTITIEIMLRSTGESAVRIPAVSLLFRYILHIENYQKQAIALFDLLRQNQVFFMVNTSMYSLQELFENEVQNQDENHTCQDDVSKAVLRLLAKKTKKML